MAAISKCPLSEEFEQLIQGRVDSANLDALEQHLQECGPCGDTVEKLMAADTMSSALANCTPMPDLEGNPTVQELIRQLINMRSSSHSVGGGTLADDAAPERDPNVAREATEQIFAFLAPAQETDELGRLGPYRVLKVLGAGGMGVVFLAEDPQLKRQVALKAMLPTLAASESARKRFLREAQTAAAIEHDHIVPIYQVGQDRGVPFIAMPFLQGEPLDKRLERGALPLDQILRIGQEIAEGLQAAHERGLIHRDIKPSNIWLEGKRGRVKILDFGLARAAGEESHLTQQGAIVGTPAYMAPEQASGLALDRRCDLFSLGVVLYRMTTGELPFKGADAISTLMAVAGEKPLAPQERNAGVPASLSDLVMGLLAKKVDDRCSSAQIVAEALRTQEQTALTSTPAPPVRPGAERVTAKQSGSGPGHQPRSRGPWLVSGLFLATVVAAACFFIRVQTAEGEFIIETDNPDVAVALEKPGTVVLKNTRTGAEYRVRSQKLPAGDYELIVNDVKSGLEFSTPRFTIKGKDTAAAVSVWFQKKVGALTAKSSVSEKPIGPASSEPITPLALVRAPVRFKGVKSWTLETHGPRGWFRSLSYSPKGTLLATAGNDGAIRIWDPAANKLVRIFLGHAQPMFTYSSVTRHTAYALGWLPDGKTLGSMGNDGTFRLWDVSTGRASHVMNAGERIWFNGWACSPDGKELALADSKGNIKFRDTASGKLLRTIDKTSSTAVDNALAWSPDGKELACATFDAVRIIDPTGARPPQEAFKTTEEIYSVGWSPDGKVLGGRAYRFMYLWDRPGGKQIGKIPVDGGTWGTNPMWIDNTTVTVVNTLSRIGDEKSFRSVPVDAYRAHLGVWSPDGQTLGAASFDSRLDIWNAATGKLSHTLTAGYRTEPNYQLSWTGDSKLLATFAIGNTIRLIDPERGQIALTVSMAPNALPGFLATNRDGTFLAYSVSDSKTMLLYLRDAATGKEIKLAGHPGPNGVAAASFSPDGKTLATLGHDDKVVRLWDMTGKLGRVLERDRSGGRLVWSPDGKMLAAVAGEITLWHTDSGKEVHKIPLSVSMGDFVWSPDGKYLACANKGSQIVIVNPNQGKIVTQWNVPEAKGQSRIALTWLPDHTLVSLDVQGSLRFWDAGSAKVLQTKYVIGTGTLHPSQLGGVQPRFSPDGRTLAMSPTENLVVLLDTETARPRGVIAFLPDGGYSTRPQGAKGPVDDVPFLLVSPDGHYRASDPRIEKNLVYVVETDDGVQETLTPAEMTKRYGWKNDPDRARLAPAGKAAGDASSKGPLAETFTNRLDIRPMLARSDFDKLNGVGLSEYEKKVAGDGDPAKVPRQLVAIIGESRLSSLLDGLGAVAFSPDGKHLATRSGGLQMWDTATGQQIAAHRTWAGNVDGVAYSPDGKKLALSRNDKHEVEIWDVATNEVLQTLKGHTKEISAIVYSPDSKWLASLADFGPPGELKVWKADTGEEGVRIPGDVRAVAFTADGKCLATCHEGGMVKFWDLPTGKELRALLPWPKRNGTETVALSPDGRQYASANNTGTIKVWDATSGKELHSFGHKHWGHAPPITYSPDGKYLAVSTDWGMVSVRDAATGAEVQRLRGAGLIAFLTFSSDSKVLTAGIRAGFYSGWRLQLWDMATGQDKLAVGGHAGAVQAIVVKADGTWFASGGADGMVRIWEAATGRQRAVLAHGGSITALALSRDGKRLAAANVRTGRIEIKVWDPLAEKELYTSRDPVETNSITFSPDGSRLAAVARGSALVIWDAATGEPLVNVPKVAGHGIAYSPDGKYLVTGHNQAVILRDPATGQEIRSIPVTGVANRVAFDPSGRQLLVSSDAVRFYDITTGKEAMVMQQPPISGSSVALARHSADGGLVAGVDIAKVHVWHAATGKVLLSLPAKRGNFIRDLAVTPDGRHLIVANVIGTLYVYRLAEPLAAPSKLPTSASPFDQLRREDVPADAMSDVTIGMPATASADVATFTK